MSVEHVRRLSDVVIDADEDEIVGVHCAPLGVRRSVRRRSTGRGRSGPWCDRTHPAVKASGPHPGAPSVDYKGPMELTTVADDQAVVHDGRGPPLRGPRARHRPRVRRLRRPHPRPTRRRVARRFATVNDVHFGETVCGDRRRGRRVGHVLGRARRAAVPRDDERRRGRRASPRIDPDAVVVKGDLTSDGTSEEYERFLEVYGGRSVTGSCTCGATTRATTASTADAPARQAATSPASRWRCSTRRGTGPSTATWTRTSWTGSTTLAAARSPGAGVRPPPVWNPTPSAAATTLRHRPDDTEALVDGRSPGARRCSATSPGTPTATGSCTLPGAGECPSSRSRASRTSPGAGPSTGSTTGGCCRCTAASRPPRRWPGPSATRAMFGGTYPEYARGRLRDRCFAIGTVGARVSRRARRPPLADLRVVDLATVVAGPGAPATWPTSAPTSSRSSGPGTATPCATWAGATRPTT